MGEKTLEFECVIKAPLETVWAYHQNVNKSLPAIMPSRYELRVELAEAPRQIGSRVIVSLRGLFNRRIEMITRYVEFVPPHPVAFGDEARYADEQVEGPFKFWRHEREMDALNARTTRLIDRLRYEPVHGMLGKIWNAFVIRPRLRAIFAHRHRMLKKLLERKGWAEATRPVCNNA